MRRDMGGAPPTINIRVDRSDARLLQLAAEGDPDAFAEFFRRHVRAVTAYAVRRCGAVSDVADVVSETFLAALLASGRYRPQSDTALPWVFGIARRVLARQRRLLVGSMRLAQRVSNTTPRFEGTEEDSIAAAIDATREADRLGAAMASLSKGERDVLELVAYDGLTPGEAAVVLDLSANAARLKLSRARRRMREALAPEPVTLHPEAGRAI